MPSCWVGLTAVFAVCSAMRGSPSRHWMRSQWAGARWPTCTYRMLKALLWYAAGPQLQALPPLLTDLGQVGTSLHNESVSVWLVDLTKVNKDRDQAKSYATLPSYR